MRASRRVGCAVGEETGSGSLLGLAIVGSTMAALALLIPLYSGLAMRESVGDAADASALAAADVASGAAAGIPCEVARRVASANHAVLDTCVVDGLVVTVRANDEFLGVRITVTATAGPPVVGTD